MIIVMFAIAEKVLEVGILRTAGLDRRVEGQGCFETFIFCKITQGQVEIEQLGPSANGGLP
jgi:hypothetical protein